MTKVFSLSLLALLTTATVAQAENRHEISHFDTILFDGQTLGVTYSTGGGCEKHTGTFELKLDRAKKNVTVKLFDVTPKPDFCEAYLRLDARIDLKAEVEKLAAENNLSPVQTYELNISLPKVQLKPSAD